MLKEEEEEEEKETGPMEAGEDEDDGTFSNISLDDAGKPGRADSATSFPLNFSASCSLFTVQFP